MILEFVKLASIAALATGAGTLLVGTLLVLRHLDGRARLGHFLLPRIDRVFSLSFQFDKSARSTGVSMVGRRLVIAGSLLLALGLLLAFGHRAIRG